MARKIRCLLLAALLASLVVSRPAWAGTEGAGNVAAVLIPAAAIGVTALEDDGKGGYQLLYSLSSTAALTYGLNLAIDKETPDGDSGAFPSGHASLSFASATYLQRRYGWRYGLPAYGAAAFVGWSRVDADRHDWTDVVGGAALGAGCAFFFTDRKGEFSLAPWSDSQGHIAGIMLERVWK